MAVGEIAEWVASGAVVAGVGWAFVDWAVHAEERSRLRVAARVRARRAERAASRGPGRHTSAIPDPSRPQAPRDLSLADDRFSPQLLGAALAHAVEAWEESSDDSDPPLRAVATPPVVDALIGSQQHGPRQYVRDATLEHWDVRGVNESAPPTWTLVTSHELR